MKAVSIFHAPATGWRFAFSLFVFSLILLPFFTAEVAAQTSLPGYTPPAVKPTPEMPLGEKVRHGKAPLSRIATQVKLESVSVRRLPELNAREMRAERKSARLRIGAVRQLNQPLAVPRDSTEFQLSEGKLYLMRITTPGAVMARLHFNNVRLPPGARLFVYSRANPDDAHPLHIPGENGLNVVGEREFWTPPMSGGEIVVEYLVSRDAASESAAQPFVIDQVSHIFLDPRSTQQDGAAACNLNVPAEWSEAAKSVGFLQFATPKGEFACSGVLLNTSRTDNQPFFLTANHCLSDSRFVNTVTVNWLYTSGNQPGSGSPRTHGGTVIATGVAGDFSLMQLNSIPPGVRRAGWSAEPVAAGTPITSVHHPQASYQRFAAGQSLAGNCPSDLPNGCEHFLPVRWQQGITEPGSSGAPLFAGTPDDLRVVGALSGGLSACNNRQGVDYYGRFEQAFPVLAPYLIEQGCAFVLQATAQQGAVGHDAKTQEIFSAAGGDGKIRLFGKGFSGCAWTARAEADWITLTSPAEGTANAIITYFVAPHTGASPRQGYLFIAGHRLLVSQMGGNNCTTAIPTDIGQFAGGALTNSDCRSMLGTGSYVDRYTFNAQAGQQFSIRLTSSAFDTFLLLYGPDGKVIDFNDDSNYSTDSTLPPEVAWIEVTADGVYTIDASSFDADETGSYLLAINRVCALSFTQEPALLPAAGGNGQINVKAPRGCAWTAQVESANWLTLTSSSGNGPGAIAFTATANPAVAFDRNTYPREARLNVLSNTYGFSPTVKQNYACGYRVSPNSISIAPYNVSGNGNLSGLLEIGSGGGCGWTAKSNSPWLEFQQYGSNFEGEGSGALALRFKTLKLGDAPRVGTLTIAGQTVTVTQQPTGVLCPASELTVGQTLYDSLLPNCPSLSGIVGSVKQYKLRGRAGQRLVFTLTSAETFPQLTLRRLLSADEADLSFGEGVDLFELREGQTMRLPREGFITLPADGDYLLDVSPGSYSNGQPGSYALSVREAGDCEVTLDRGRHHLTAAAASGRLAVNNPSQCGWTPTVSAPWIKIVSATNGQIEYQIEPNTGAYRSGAIFIAGKHLIITQQPANAPGIVSAADYTPNLTGGAIQAFFGVGLATQTIVADTIPLPTMLGGTQLILTTDKGDSYDAPLFFVSPGQINFLMPHILLPGVVTFTVKVNGQTAGVTRVAVGHLAPALFTANGSGSGLPAAYLVRVRADGTYYEEAIFNRDNLGRITPRPIRLPDDEQVYLILYGTGFKDLPSGGVEIEATFQTNLKQKGVVFRAPGFVGLDQINLLLPRSLRGQGEVTLTIKHGGAGTNPVTIQIAPQ
jgi:uncharacterized protein (TIGR03437 family)